jgi:protocatechuate 3,4-dioxygenase beta subunit
VREYFQRDIERTKKATTEQARQRVAREEAATAGNNPAGGYDEEAQIQDAINLSRAEAEFRQGWKGEEVLMSVEGVVVRRG